LHGTIRKLSHGCNKNEELMENQFHFFQDIQVGLLINLDYSRVKNAVRSGDDAACKGVLKYVEQAARKQMR